MNVTRLFGAALSLAACMGVVSCGGGSGGSTPTGTGTTKLEMAPSAPGDGQSATVATALPAPLQVLVTVNGTPQAGDTVTWATAGTGASVSPATSATDTNGVAATTWTLSQTAGMQSATASLSGASGSPVTFTATATAGPAIALMQDAGNNQLGTVGTSLPAPLAVAVTDRYGNPVAGIPVAWQVTVGSATVSPSLDTTAADGTAQASVTLGSAAGADTIAASSPGLTGSPVVFDVTASLVPVSASVDIGNIFFKSAQNGTENPAVDTVAVGGKVTWTWTVTNNHSVQSLGSPSFASSAIQSTGSYAVTFDSAGTYNYDCAVHGTAMTGTVVVR